MPTRALPVLDLAPLRAPAPPAAEDPVDPRVAEFLPDDVVLPRYHVWTLGCQMNRSDSEEMAGALEAAGCAPAPSLESADLIVINTCSIREAAEHKVVGRMGVLRQLKRANPALRVVLTGCSVRADNLGTLPSRYPAVDLFLRPDQEPDLVAHLGLAAPAAARTTASPLQRVGRGVAAVADRLPASRATAIRQGRVAREDGARAWVPVIYGCDKTCTYCIVPFSRGPERSRPFDEILDEVRSVAGAGYREVTLLGQNVNSYGHDLPADPRFADVRPERELGRRLDLRGKPDIAALLRAIDDLRTDDGAPAIGRVRFVTSHPWDLSERLIAAMAECASVCEHLHLPVQAGDDAVLRRMGRQYTVESYVRLVERLRAAIPGIALTTDVIVGFCGETEAQFEATLDLLRTVRFDQVFAAAFSPRPGTPAARLPDDVPPEEKRGRLNTLLALQERIGLERNAMWVGRETEVLVETVAPARSHLHTDGPPPAAPAPGPDDVRLSGRNREHKLVHLAGPAALVGELVRVRLDRAGPYALVGSRLA